MISTHGIIWYNLISKRFDADIIYLDCYLYFSVFFPYTTCFQTIHQYGYHQTLLCLLLAFSNISNEFQLEKSLEIKFCVFCLFLILCIFCILESSNKLYVLEWIDIAVFHTLVTGENIASIWKMSRDFAIVILWSANR